MYRPGFIPSRTNIPGVVLQNWPDPTVFRKGREILHTIITGVLMYTTRRLVNYENYSPAILTLPTILIIYYVYSDTF